MQVSAKEKKQKQKHKDMSKLKKKSSKKLTENINTKKDKPPHKEEITSLTRTKTAIKEKINPLDRTKTTKQIIASILDEILTNLTYETIIPEEIEVNVAKEISRVDAVHQDNITLTQTRKLDSLLSANGLVRLQVNPDGNCFFEAALLHLENMECANELRQILCTHIVENANEYVTFFSTNDTNESFEEDILWIDFRTEVEELRSNGAWTNRASDLLPLALAN